MAAEDLDDPLYRWPLTIPLHDAGPRAVPVFDVDRNSRHSLRRLDVRQLADLAHRKLVASRERATEPGWPRTRNVASTMPQVSQLHLSFSCPRSRPLCLGLSEGPIRGLRK